MPHLFLCAGQLVLFQYSFIIALDWRWPRSCSDLPGPASYSRITESRAGIHRHVTRNRLPLLDVIKATEGATRDGIHGKHWRDLESLLGYHQVRMASQIVEDALHRVTIADLQGTSFQPHRKLRCSALPKLARRSSIHGNTSYIACDPVNPGPGHAKSRAPTDAMFRALV
jgi:hypothetical protein